MFFLKSFLMFLVCARFFHVFFLFFTPILFVSIYLRNYKDENYIYSDSFINCISGKSSIVSAHLSGVMIFVAFVLVVVVVIIFIAVVVVVVVNCFV